LVADLDLMRDVDGYYYCYSYCLYLYLDAAAAFGETKDTGGASYDVYSYDIEKLRARLGNG